MFKVKSSGFGKWCFLAGGGDCNTYLLQHSTCFLSSRISWWLVFKDYTLFLWIVHLIHEMQCLKCSRYLIMHVICITTCSFEVLSMPCHIVLRTVLLDTWSLMLLCKSGKIQFTPGVHLYLKLSMMTWGCVNSTLLSLPLSVSDWFQTTQVLHMVFCPHKNLSQGLVLSSLEDEETRGQRSII